MVELSPKQKAAELKNTAKRRRKNARSFTRRGFNDSARLQRESAMRLYMEADDIEGLGKIRRKLREIGRSLRR